MKRNTFILVFLASFFFGGMPRVAHNERAGNVPFSTFLGSLFFVDSVTVPDLRMQFAMSENGGISAEKIKILVVPGHDNESIGAVFGGLRESDLTLLLGKQIAELLSTRNNFEVILARDNRGYTSPLGEYLIQKKSEILSFAALERQIMDLHVKEGLVSYVEFVDHNFASPEVAAKLYGINKWANENGVDIVLHVHFNDYPRRRRSLSGEYSGFSIYVPERQFSNAKASRTFAESLFTELSHTYPKSNLPKEELGIVEDQELIAIGSNNSLDAVGVVVEYGYIYEPQFQYSAVRTKVIEDLAFQTYRGINRFFERELATMPENAYLPYLFTRDLKEGIKGSVDVLALQAALMKEGTYPADQYTRYSCPLSGNFGPCTVRALTAFQTKRGIQEKGFVGEQTRMVLNNLYGIR